MRLNCTSIDTAEQKELKEFADWILDIGDGKTTSDEGDDPKETIVKNTYPELLSRYQEPKYLEERAKLCPRNETVEEINDYIMSQIEGDEVTYHSSDSVCKASTNSTNMEDMYPTEFLNSLKFPGIPNHELKLKVGLPVMLHA